ncbi:MAG: RNA chaperone Hfq [Oscillospiraceae bacterium]
MTKTKNLQDAFLATAARTHASVIVFLMNGYQLRGRIHSFDPFAVELYTEDKQQIIYKHAISTIIPEKAIHWEEDPVKVV